MPIADNLKLVAEVTLKGTVAAGGSSAKTFFNVFHFRRTATTFAYDNTGIANEFIASLVGPITDALNVDWTTVGVSSRCVNDALDTAVEVADVTPGAIAGDRLMDFCAATLILRTALRGASYRGKKHFGPMSESDVGDDIFNAGALVNINAIKTAVLAGFTDANGNIWVPVVLSRIKSQLLINPTTVVATDVTEILTNKTVGTMRRRKVATVR